MRLKQIEPEKNTYNLMDYPKEYHDFNVEEWKSKFSWHKTGKVNIAYECIDRHVGTEKENKIALFYEDNHRKESFTFKSLSENSNRFGNLLRHQGIQKGDRVFVFMPRSPELYISVLGALKIGAIVGPLFEAFMENAVKDRLEDSEAVAIVTTPELLSRIPFNELPLLKHVIVVNKSENDNASFIDYHSEMDRMSTKLDIEWMDLEDGFILHYTSGSTGKPKGVLHAQRAMIQHLLSGHYVLDFKEDDVYWCTADPGWVTGTSYGIFSPWLNGVTNVIRGGRFSPHDWYQTIEDYKVTVWYSAPTAFRMLMGNSNDIVKQYDLHSLRHVLSVGEPLNPEVVYWGLDVFNKRIHDTWWMTETGAHMICNYPSMTIKPGSMGKSLPGVEAAIVDDRGNILPPNRMGNLAIKKGWTSMMKTIWNNQEKFESYFLHDWYVSGDSAYMDEDGYFWFEGRVDDVIMTAGERVGPFEVESKLIEHPAVQEAGVIGKPDPVRGEIIKAFIALKPNIESSDELVEDIRLFVKNSLSAHAAPREIEVRDKLPKTRSGKIMRRVLKSWELGLPTGDLSTIDDD